LTNNFSRANVPAEETKFLGWDDGAIPTHLRELFDDFCDSSSLGMRFVGVSGAIETLNLWNHECTIENRNMVFTCWLVSGTGYPHEKPSFSTTLACETFPRFIQQGKN